MEKRLDGSALFSSGDDAMTITHILINDYDYTSLKVTRVDVCVDIALQSPARGWLRGLREGQEFSDTHKRANRKTTLIESDTGDTLYIGSRDSGRFGRIYDKSLAYGLQLGYVYRFELETKKQVSQPVFDRLFPESEYSTYSWDLFADRVRGIIQTQFTTWGVELSLRSKNVEQIKAVVRISTVDSQLEWLSRTVSPMLQRLDVAGYKQESLEALGLAKLNVFSEEVAIS